MDHAAVAPRFLASRDVPPPSRLDALWFDVRAGGLRLRRAIAELGRRPPRHPVADTLVAVPVAGDYASPLWPASDADADATLVAGKIHNLRLLRRRLHGVEVPAGATFSFWRQLGRADARAGYVAGRELREGCLVPAIGGGLCQFTNALYVAALAAGLEIVERHRHSRVIPGSLAEIDRDATVFWNYLDLRLRAPFAWRIEVDMDAERLVVRVRARRGRAEAGGVADAAGSAAPAVAGSTDVIDVSAPKPRGATPTGDCSSCDRRACHRWTGPRPLPAQRTWLLDADSPMSASARTSAASDDRLVAEPAARGAIAPPMQRIAAAVGRRWARALGATNAALALRARERQARALAAQLRPDDLRLVVAQGLLPFLWRDGVLAGRHFDVLMDALPMAELQQRLDTAAAHHPQAASLRDFRAPASLVDAERAALAAADGWLSAHAQILALAGDRARPVPWPSPPSPESPPAPATGRRASRDPDAPMRVLFPAPTLARKGAVELRDALRGLPVEVLLPPGAVEAPGFWQGFAVVPVASSAAAVADADVVALPAWVEHQPAVLLRAIAAGVPVIATDACGLVPSPAWTRVAEGDVGALRAALVSTLRRTRARRATA